MRTPAKIVAGRYRAPSRVRKIALGYRFNALRAFPNRIRRCLDRHLARRRPDWRKQGSKWIGRSGTIGLSIRATEGTDADGCGGCERYCCPTMATHNAKSRPISGRPNRPNHLPCSLRSGAANATRRFVEVGTRDYAEGCATSPVALIEALYVDSDYHRAVIGRQLMKAAGTYAKGEGLKELASDVRWNTSRAKPVIRRSALPDANGSSVSASGFDGQRKPEFLSGMETMQRGYWTLKTRPNNPGRS